MYNKFNPFSAQFSSKNIHKIKMNDEETMNNNKRILLFNNILLRNVYKVLYKDVMPLTDEQCVCVYGKT